MLKDIFNPTFGFFHIFLNCGLKQPKENKARTLIVTNRSISIPNSLHRNVKTIYTGVNICSGSKKCPKTRTVLFKIHVTLIKRFDPLQISKISFHFYLKFTLL